MFWILAFWCSNSIHSFHKFKEPYDQRLVTKLRYNYRTLPCILAFYNKQFYDSSLIPTIHQRESHLAKLLTMWQCCGALPAFNYGKSRPPFGAYFINVAGKNIRLRNKKSWRNQEEKDMVCKIAFIVFSKVAFLQLPYFIQRSLK